MNVSVYDFDAPTESWRQGARVRRWRKNWNCWTNQRPGANRGRRGHLRQTDPCLTGQNCSLQSSTNSRSPRSRGRRLGLHDLSKNLWRQLSVLLYFTCSCYLVMGYIKIIADKRRANAYKQISCCPSGFMVPRNQVLIKNTPHPPPPPQQEQYMPALRGSG